MANNKKDAPPKKNIPPKKKNRSLTEWTQEKASLFVDRLLESSGLKTQAALEEDLGYTGNRISNLRNPKSSVRIPDADDMLIYAKKYGCSIDYLLGIEEDLSHSSDKETLADFAKYLFYLCDGEDIEVDAENASITFKNENIKNLISEWAEARQMPQKFSSNGFQFYEKWKATTIAKSKDIMKKWGYLDLWDRAIQVRDELTDEINEYEEWYRGILDIGGSPAKGLETSLSREDVVLMHDFFGASTDDIYNFYLENVDMPF